MQQYHMSRGQVRIKLFEFAVKPTISETVLSTCLNRLVQSHEVLRATVYEEQQYTTAEDGDVETTAFIQIQTVSTTKLVFAYETRQYETLSNCQVVLSTLGEAINVEIGPGFAAVSFTEGAQNVRFLGLLAHCSLVDGQSWDTIVKDLSHLIEREVSVQRNDDTQTFEFASEGRKSINDLAHDEGNTFRTGDVNTQFWVLPHQSRNHEEGTTWIFVPRTPAD